MDKSLVIVESPAKAKTISKYLGKNYIVKSSIGHIRDLPTSGLLNHKSTSTVKGKAKLKIKKHEKETLINRIGIDPYHGWKAHYEILPGKEKIVDELKILAKKVNHIYLATDLDREGEAIAWHLREVIGGEHKLYSRVLFNEITQKSIQQAFNNPGEINIDRVYAQQARRFMDRIVGYMISPLLWKKIARGLSAGRVQSVAVRLVVDREFAIKKFVPEEYWELRANLHIKNTLALQMQVTHVKNKIFKPINNEQIQISLKELEKESYIVSDYVYKKTSSKPYAPFITSTLQQTAHTRLGFSVKKTMMLAQRLYETGYITYMRTDSTNLSQDAMNMVRDYIITNFGAQYIPKEPYIYASQNNAQEAHEAIRPTNMNILSFEQLKNIGPDAQKLYYLIWDQFISCQMTPAEYDSTTILVQAGHYMLKAKYRTLRFDGWTKILPQILKNNEKNIIPFIKIGSNLLLQNLLSRQCFTKPLIRFNEASLVKELEKRGIGRPSTYSTIISTIQDRGYVRIYQRRFYAEKMGEIVTYSLLNHFQELINYDFTAHMEDDLDQVANAKKNWQNVLDNFFHNFSNQMLIAEKDPKDGGMHLNKMVITNISCTVCKRQMGIRTASTGVFLGCSGYTITPIKKRCKNTINLLPESEILEGEDVETNALRAKKRCVICGTAMDSYFMNNSSKLLICGNNPTCNGYKIQEGKFFIKNYNDLILKCKKCHSEMQVKIGRFGKYIACTNTECNNTSKILSNGELAPQLEDPIPLPELQCIESDAYFVLRDGSAGIFLAANTFPKSRETRAPLVEELARFRGRLPARFVYMADAPQKDPKGNKTIVRFNRKTKKQYISSEYKGKATGWAAFFSNGKWIDTLST
ncbi:type I DNA topoisomerase [Candidatus Profftia sp. (ex Adelges kitamiensis)]|uniref:type I DNA topoisomerase n=1 Tax=Candidatus Profftia sp. (ex Adelges kitamiensis) TaxID=2864218 RepID=UPI001CE2DAAA|nr:type I DNA topoisomerase [Candidatus Profftia sp. (ex Adelges kitamiensis)]